ncbi:MAG: tripartite tricarboxylate transporter substrate binding protein [Betaproteobacteria bacterium]|nr:MAG: tripartite tricarboxylate transporter substrate binding protein [Betaproteobacteria bacterium]
MRIMRLLATLVLGLALGAAQAQETYPAKSVRLIAAAAPGGNPDVLARLLAAKLADTFGRPFIVENIPGAGGVVAAELLTRAPADGHVLMLGDSGAMAINPALNPKLTYNPLRDFTLITALAAVPTVLVANSALPANRLEEFVALAKSKPGQLSYGSAGSGSVHHLTMAVFASRAGIDLLHVPYKGGSALVAGLLGGEVQVGWSGIPNVAPHIRSGKLKVYAISTARRSPSLPDVPTAIEQGFPDFDIATDIGLQGPAGTPRDIVSRLQRAVAKILREPDIAERMANLGMELRENGTEDYVRFMKADMERYAQAVKTAGVRQD